MANSIIDLTGSIDSQYNDLISVDSDSSQASLSSNSGATKKRQREQQDTDQIGPEPKRAKV